MLGAGGFIGGALVHHLRAQGRAVEPVTRADLPGLLASRRPAGQVIDCIGLTADFRARPLETADAHVGLTGRFLAELDFESFLFLSSTRVYARAEDFPEVYIIDSGLIDVVKDLMREHRRKANGDEEKTERHERIESERTGAAKAP